MIFHACVKYDEHKLDTYKGIEVTMLGSKNDVVAVFESYDPVEDFRNFVSWSEKTMWPFAILLITLRKIIPIYPRMIQKRCFP